MGTVFENGIQIVRTLFIWTISFEFKVCKHIEDAIAQCRGALQQRAVTFS